MAATRTAAPETGFAAELRAATAGEHRATEGTGLAARLVGGDIDAAAYAVLAVQLRAVYTALERAARAVADDPVVGPLMDPALERAHVLDRDVAWLLAVADRPVSTEILPSTGRYVDRIDAAAGWPGGVLAHHYTRYLGDLSGGIVIGRALARALGGGVDFYRFPDHLDARAYKVAYRQRLDGAAWSARERAEIVAEVVAAYRCNGALFAEVDAVTRASGPANRTAAGRAEVGA